MQRQKLTGWLIAFIVWTGISGVNGLGSLGRAGDVWKPYMADYPSLHAAVMALQLLSGAGIAAWLYAAWVVYQRQPGTLKRAQVSLLVGGLLRLVGSWSIVLFGGLPREMSQGVMSQLRFGTCVTLLFTGAWYCYLARSKRVKEIYAG